MVQLSEGPTTGSVSQNCVCRSAPPGELKQHRSETADVLWHDSCGLLQVAEAAREECDMDVSTVVGPMMPKPSTD